MVCLCFCIFFFKQKTAYEMRISDWSSDVCSSDLLLSRSFGRAALLAGDFSADERMAAFLIGMSERLAARGFSPNRFALTMPRTDIANYLRLAPETDRKSVV